MPYDEHLESRIMTAIDGWKNVSAKKMFGGVCHLIHDLSFDAASISIIFFPST
jgi:hypothetical protein